MQSGAMSKGYKKATWYSYKGVMEENMESRVKQPLKHSISIYMHIYYSCRPPSLPASFLSLPPNFPKRSTGLTDLPPTFFGSANLPDLRLGGLKFRIVTVADGRSTAIGTSSSVCLSGSCHGVTPRESVLEPRVDGTPYLAMAVTPEQ